MSLLLFSNALKNSNAFRLQSDAGVFLYSLRSSRTYTSFYFLMESTFPQNKLFVVLVSRWRWGGGEIYILNCLWEKLLIPETVTLLQYSNEGELSWQSQKNLKQEDAHVKLKKLLCNLTKTVKRVFSFKAISKHTTPSLLTGTTNWTKTYIPTWQGLDNLYQDWRAGVI